MALMDGKLQPPTLLKAGRSAGVALHSLQHPLHRKEPQRNHNESNYVCMLQSALDGINMGGDQAKPLQAAQ